MSAQSKTQSWKQFLKRPKIVRRFKQAEDGATAIEFAFLAGPFFLLIFAIIESSIFFLAGQYLESGVDTVGRMVRTGQLDGSTTEAEFKTEICTSTSLLFDCDSIKVDLSVAATFDDLGDPPEPDSDGNYDSSAFGFTPPGASQIVMITVMYEWPILTNYAAPLMTNSTGKWALMTATAVFRTEPYQ